METVRNLACLDRQDIRFRCCECETGEAGHRLGNISRRRGPPPSTNPYFVDHEKTHWLPFHQCIVANED